MKSHTHRATLVMDLAGPQGNAFAVLGNCKKAMKQLGADQEYIDWYMKRAMAGDYDSLLEVSKTYLNIIDSSLTYEFLDDDRGEGEPPIPEDV